jgi:hypothetical protein
MAAKSNANDVLLAVHDTTNDTLKIGGLAADGAAVAGNPMLVAGTDGTNAQTVSVDTTGRQVVVGAAADGAAVSGNPVRIAGKDGSGNTQDLLLAATGQLLVSAIEDPVAVTISGVAADQNAINTYPGTEYMYHGGSTLTVKRAVIDHATGGDNTLVAAVASKKVRVLSVFLVAAGAVTVRFESGASGTALTGQMTVAANGVLVLPFNQFGWFETAVNTLLNLELGGAVSVDGALMYIEVF